MRALAPAKVREVRLHEDTGIAEVIVPDFQLSLAIGKEGQNARLAARLTGWRVDIKSETQLAEEESGARLRRGRVGRRPRRHAHVAAGRRRRGDQRGRSRLRDARRRRAPRHADAPAADAATPARRRGCGRSGDAAEAATSEESQNRRSERAGTGRRGRGELTPAPGDRDATRRESTPAAPQRTCVGCRRRGSPSGWQRIAAGRDGAVRMGRTAPGRGAWCCSAGVFRGSGPARCPRPGAATAADDHRARRATARDTDETRS